MMAKVEWRMVSPQGIPTGPQSFKPAPVFYKLDGSRLQRREDGSEWEDVTDTP